MCVCVLSTDYCYLFLDNFQFVYISNATLVCVDGSAETQLNIGFVDQQNGFLWDGNRSVRLVFNIVYEFQTFWICLSDPNCVNRFVWMISS